MARNPRKQKDTDAVASELLKAFEFISLVQSDGGNLYECHCSMRNNAICAFNGILAAGITVREDLAACPHTLRMRDALANCGQELSITKMSNDSISIRSERFKAIVPCVEEALLYLAEPDLPCATINDSLKEGFEQIAHVTTETGKRVIETSILLQNNTMVATNGFVMLEYWHGINLPPQLVIPKAAVTILCKVKKPLAKLGFSPNTITFYYEDNSWIRTQRYVEAWPDTNKVLNMVSYPKDVATSLFSAIDSVAPFTENEHIYLRGDTVQSHGSENVGASYKVDDFKAKAQINYKYWKQAQPHMRQVDFTVRNGAIYFFGNKTRGVLSVVHENKTGA